MEHIGEILILQPNLILAEGKKDALPAIGSILKTKSSSLQHYLVVIEQIVDSRIPGRFPQAYGLPEEKVEEEHPHFAFLLSWMFQVFPVLQKRGNIFSIPDTLPKIHSLVYEVDDRELLSLYKTSNLVNILFSLDEASFPKRNEIALKLLKKIIAAVPEKEKSDAIYEIFSSLTRYFRNDYYSLRKIMRELEEL